MKLFIIICTSVFGTEKIVGLQVQLSLDYE